MSHPVPMFGTQNLEDDDAAVIDSYTQEVNAPPDMTSATEPIEKTPDTGIAVTTRILSMEQTIDPSWTTPTQILPADENRTQFHMRVTSPTAVATDGIRWASRRDECNSAGRLLHGQTSGAVDGHTGAIWVIGQAATGSANSAPVSISIWAVTK